MNIQTLKDYGYKPHGVKMREDNIFLRHWLNIICAVVVTVATAKISFELSHISSYRYWVLLIFSVLVWCVGQYVVLFMVSKTEDFFHSSQSVRLYNAYASLQYFANVQIVDFVPESPIHAFWRFVIAIHKNHHDKKLRLHDDI